MSLLDLKIEMENKIYVLEIQTRENDKNQLENTVEITTKIFLLKGFKFNHTSDILNR